MSDSYNCYEKTKEPRSIAHRTNKKTRITVAPNGARRQKTDHAALPLTISEIAETARACHTAGAEMIHLHVRDPAGAHSLDAGLYSDAIGGIGCEAPGMAVQITTESGGVFDVTDQLACLHKLRPAAASISVREIMRAPDLAPRIYATAAEAGTEVQHILYDTDDLATLRRMIDTQIVPSDMRAVLLVLGRYTPPRPARVSELAPFVAALAGDFPDWTACAFGANEHAVMLEATRLGGNVRIGFENNICRPDGTPATNNAENIARFVSALKDTARKEPTQ